MMPIEVYTDGSCLGNPGPAGLAYIIRYWPENDAVDEMPKSTDYEGKVGFRLSTNNRMEIMAGLYGIREVLRLIEAGSIQKGTVSVMSDSQYFINAITKHWIDKWSANGWMTASHSLVKNKDLWEQMISLLKECASKGIILAFTHVLGHNGNEYNEKADKLAVSASNDSSGYKVDEVFEREQANRWKK